MTKRERAQVVELLRVAADFLSCRGGFWDACRWLGIPAEGRIAALGWSARSRAQNIVGRGDDEVYRHALLEAAARVEEGSWP